MSLSKKKRWKRTVICIMVFCVCASVIALGFLINNGHSVKGANITNLPGAGTVNNPFRISSRADLDFLANAINAPVTAPDRFAHLRGATRHFVLTNNIDMGGMFNPWTTPIGHGTAANRFSGVFDGNGHTISNLFFDSNVAVNNYGLFGVTTSATIRNLNLHQATIMVDGAGTNIAPLVGHAMQITHIENVSVSSGSSVMAGLSVGVGGLVGRSIGTSADAANSFRLSSSGATVIGSSLVGGLVGIGTSSTFRECFASGTVEGTLLNTVVGGFIGEIAATTRVGNAEVLRWAFYNNYASGQVIASNTQGSPTTIAVGGFVGRVIGATRMTNVYASGNIMVNAEAGTIRVGGLVGHALATTEIVGSAAIMQQINQSGGTRHIGLLAAGAAPTSTTINRNNMMNSQMMNIFAEGVPIGADIQIGTVFSAAINSNRLVPFSGFSNQQTWTDVPTVVAGVQGYDNFDFNLTWAIDPNVNRGHPILRGFQNEEGYSGGTGTPNNPFRIDTLSDFLRFRQNVARGNTYANRHFNLTANINLMEENWTPIPNFLGTFDGGGNIISGLSITSRTVNDTGLFALLGIGGAIRNLTLLNPSVTGITGQNTGLLVGRALNNTIIENITITNGFVESRNINTGGLVGYSHGTAIATGNTIRNISVGGTILASGQTGGIIGRAEFTTMSIVGFNGEVLRNATGNLAGWHNFGGLIGFATGGENRISNSFARANIRDACSEFSVSTIAATAGGLVGFNGVAIRISNSYYAGGIIEAHTQSVTANAANSAYAGGLIGFSNTAASILVSLTNNFVASSTILARADTPNLENLFFVSASNFLNSPANRIPTMQNNMYSNDVVTIMNNAQITTGIPYDVGINVPRVNLSTVSFWTLGAFVGGLGWDFNNVWTLGGVATGNLPVHRTMFEDADFGGRGTIENPYRIRTAGDLRNMRDMVNQGNRFRGRFFRMENDIDLGGSTWTPIGLTDIITFAGNFDGGGYQISGLNVNRTIDNKGFFGHTTGATVENLTLHEPQVQRTTGHNTGALIGRALSTVVSNIHIEGGEISADPSADEIGTVIGRADAGTSLYRVSSNALLSQGRHGAGGLIGFAVGTAAAPVVITHSYFAGNITTQGAHYVGGLVGISRGVIIDQSYNAGSITVRARTIGGLIGHNYSVPSTIRNSYNIGNLTITFNRISGASTTARNALLNLGGIVANTWGVPVAMENVINLGELRQVNTWSVVSIGGIYGRADASLGNTMFGAVSAGKLHLESLVRSRAWFANGSAATNIPLPAGRGGLLWLDELDTAITRAVVGTAAANLRLHDDEDAEAKTREQLNIWQTYEDIGFNSDIWAIDPSGEINMGFPYLRDVETVMPRTGSGSMRLEITSTEEFLEFRDAVNAGNSFIGLTILVKTDIHLTGIFQQIGQITTPFSGTIDFGGHTIYGLNIQGSATNTGLFGYANRGAVIKNLYIHDPNVRGTANVGGLIGHANGDVAIYNVHITGDSGLVHGSGGQVGGFIGRITNGFNVSIRWSSSNATVRGVADTGGFVGLSISTWGNQNLIADSFKTGNVESTGSDVGGLIGEARNARIERSYTSGIVRSTLDNVGGLVGAPRIMRVDIVDSFSTSSVIGRNRVGGLVGATIIATTITNSYARGLVQSTVTTTAAASLAGIIGENHRVAIASIRMEGVAAINRGVIAPRTTTGARMASVAVGDNSDALTPTVAHSPGTTFLANMNVGLASTVRLFGHPLQNTNPAWLPAARRPESRTLEEYQNLETFVQKGWSEDVWEIRAGYNDNLPLLRNLPFVADERLGSESNPILINNLDELVQFRNSVNAGNTFFGQVVRLTDSINLADEEWLPIGSSVVNHFGGTFEGGGHFIRNMTITRSAAQTGFFGFTNAATIRNLGFVNVNITSSNTSSTADTGVVIGQSMSTLVLDRVVVFGGNVQASGQNTGGLVGRMLLSNNSITHSFVDNVRIETTSLYAGGLVGSMESGTVRHSYFRGTMHGTNTSTTPGYMAGIVGRITNNANVWAPLVQDVMVMGVIRDSGPNATASGIIGRNERADTVLQGGRTVVERVLVNATIEASATQVTSSARRSVAMGIVGETTTPMVIRNSAVVGIQIRSNAVDVRHAIRAHPIGIGTVAAAAITNLPTGTVATNSNRIQSFAHTLTAGTQALAWISPALTGAQEPIEDPMFFRGVDAQTNYENDLGWNFASTWAINPVLNEGLPNLQDMPVVIDMLFVAIDNARDIDRSLFSEHTLGILDDAVEYVEQRIATTANITNDHVALWLIHLESALNGLRADSSALEAKLAHIMHYPSGVFYMQDQFLSFAHMNAMIENASRLIESTRLAPLGHNRVTNPMIQNALAALELAYESLLLDMTYLRQLVQLANQRNQIHYSMETWLPFAQSRLEAMLILGNAFSTRNQVQTAFDNLYNAMNNLRFDIQGLTEYIRRAHEIYTNYPNNWYPDIAFFHHTWERFVIAYNEARCVLIRYGVTITREENGITITVIDPSYHCPICEELGYQRGSVTGAEVASATFNLQFALNTLDVDKSKLIDLINSMLLVQTAGYTTITGDAFIEARDAAQAEFMRGDSTPTTVRLAKDNLNSTYFLLQVDGARFGEIVDQANILNDIYIGWRNDPNTNLPYSAGSLPYPPHPDFLDLFKESQEWDIEEWEDFSVRIEYMRNLLTGTTSEELGTHPSNANQMLAEIYTPNMQPTRFPTAVQVAAMAHDLALRIDNIIVNQRMLELRIEEAQEIIRRFGTAPTHYLTDDTRDELQIAIDVALDYLNGTYPARPTLAGLRAQREILQNAIGMLRFNMQLLHYEINKATNEFSIHEEYFTIESFATFTQSLDNAVAEYDTYINGVLDTREYERLVVILHELRNSISMLLTDLSELEELMLYTGTLNPAYFTYLSWANLENAISYANTILFGTNPTIQTLRNTIQNLQDALGSLLLNFNALDDVVDQIEQRLLRARVPRPNETPPRHFYRATELGILQGYLDQANAMRLNSGTNLNQMLDIIERLLLSVYGGTYNSVTYVGLVVDDIHVRDLITWLQNQSSTDYTQATWELLQEQISRSKDFLDLTFNPETHTTDHLVVQYQMLLDAFNALEADTSALTALVNIAGRVRQNFVTEETWEPFQIARSAAVAILNYQGRLTVTEVQNAYADLENAMEELVANRIPLQGLVNDVSIAPYYTIAINFLTDSWTAFLASRNAGVTAAANVNINVFDLMEIYDELRIMHANLLPDLEPLSNLLGDAFEFDRSQFTQETSAQLTNAINFATGVLEPPPPSIREVFEAIRKLEEAMSAMVVEKSELKALIAQVEAKDPSLYTTTSWNALITQLNAARSFIEIDSSDVTALETYIENLLYAIYNLAFQSGTLDELLAKAQYHLPYARYYTLESFMALIDAVTFANDVIAQGLPSNDSGWISAAQNLLDALARLISIRNLRHYHEIARIFQKYDIRDDIRWDELVTVIHNNEQLFINGSEQAVLNATIATRNAVEDALTEYHYFTILSWNAFQVQLVNAINGNQHELRQVLDNLVYVGNLVRIISEIEQLAQDTTPEWLILLQLMEYNDVLLNEGTRQEIDDHVVALRNALNNILADTLLHIALNPLMPGYQILRFIDAAGNAIDGHHQGDVFLANFAAGELLETLLAQFINKGLRVFESLNQGEQEIIDLNTTVATGMQIKLFNGESVIDKVTIVVIGDVRGLGNPNNADVGRLQAHVRGQLLESANFLAADIRGLNNPNNSDVGLLQSHVRGSVDIFDGLRLQQEQGEAA